jgi:hypothetical protein
MLPVCTSNARSTLSLIGIERPEWWSGGYQDLQPVKTPARLGCNLSRYGLISPI